MAQTTALEQLWAAAARSALGVEAQDDEEVPIDLDENMAEDEDAGGFEGMTAEEEAEAARLIQEELAALEGEGEVELEAEVEAEAGAEAGAEAEAEAGDAAKDMEVAGEEEEVEVAVDPEPVAEAKPVQPRPTRVLSLRPSAPQAYVRPAALQATAGKGYGCKGFPWKGDSKGKGDAKGKGKGSFAPCAGKGKGGEAGKGGEFFGLVHQVGEKTGNMLVKSWKVSERFGQEAMIPKMANPAGAGLGDKISFDVLEREGARPLAVNVQVRGHVDLAAEGAPSEVRRQVLYYLSDDNLRTDKFFQDIIAQSEGGWISMTTILGCPRMKQMKASLEGVFSALKGCSEVELREAPEGEEAIRRTSPPPPLEAKGSRDGKGPMGKGQAKGAPIVGGGKSAAGPGKVTSPPASVVAGGATGGGQVAADKGAADATAASSGLGVTAPAQEAPKVGTVPTSAASEAGACEEIYYVGLVKSQMRMEPRKLFISCDEITQVYGRDAYFLPNQKPKAIEVGSLVVFSVPGKSEVGFSPQANFVGQLAPLGSLGRQEANSASQPAPVSSVAQQEETEKSNGASVGKGPGVQRTIVKRGGKGVGH